MSQPAQPNPVRQQQPLPSSPQRTPLTPLRALRRRARRPWLPALAVAALCTATAACAEEGARAARVPLLPAYQSECAACHVAYPPGLLGAASWQRLMAGLPTHFGSNAALDAVTVRQISQWLVAHAASGPRAAAVPPDDRITRSAWFQREHHGLPAAVWQRPAIRSAANCAACHTRADQGVFDEHDVRIPR